MEKKKKKESLLIEKQVYWAKRSRILWLLDHLLCVGEARPTKHCTCERCVMSTPSSENSGKRKSEKMEDQSLEGKAPAEKRRNEDNPPISTATGVNTPQPSTSDGGIAAALPPSEDSSFVAPATEDFQKLCDEMSKELDLKADGDGISYAAMLRARRKIYPYALFILAADSAKENLSKPHFDAFQDYVFHARIKLTAEENGKLIIDWMVHKNYYGVAACTSKETALWLKSQAAVFKFEEKSTCNNEMVIKPVDKCLSFEISL